jgi:hypothetical protein
VRAARGSLWPEETPRQRAKAKAKQSRAAAEGRQQKAGSREAEREKREREEEREVGHTKAQQEWVIGDDNGRVEPRSTQRA